MVRGVLLALLLALVAGLQFRLWFGDGGVTEVMHLRDRVAEQRAENERLAERNRALEADVADLKDGLDAVGERARRELGMVGEGETFFQVTGGRDRR
ncbi:Cell division protein FtsB [wastewater metagenome]|uniref:Cell division protein FtsB n=2 Tax=unclassified sequences TaxID=12908 RepID=A0A5B8R7G4_9ZZZZ|nr:MULTISPECIES: cell division protein FtsB [Arhodomonas]QEA04626.1 cell division protein FtsB [uncultured organism]